VGGVPDTWKGVGWCNGQVDTTLESGISRLIEVGNLNY